MSKEFSVVVKKDDEDLAQERENDLIYPSCHCHAKLSTETELWESHVKVHEFEYNVRYSQIWSSS